MSDPNGAAQRAMAYLLHVDTPRVASPLKAIIAGILGMTVVLGIWFAFVDMEAAMAMFAVTVFDALLFRAIVPRRYEVWSDRVKVVLGGPLGMNIPLHNIAEARAVAGEKAFFYWGLRLATANRGVVEIVRRKGLNVVISPADRETFLQRLAQAAHRTSASGQIAQVIDEGGMTCGH